MKQLIFILTILLLTKVSMAQTPPVRLHVQASKNELAGDGDDYTTILVTARDPEGEIITTLNGKVALRCSSGFLDESEFQMNNGVAFTKYTAPIFGQPIKAAQRMVYFMVKFIRKFLSRFGGSTHMESNQKLAGNIALETFKEGLNPLTLIPQKDGDNFVYFVAEMNEIKGKTKINIVKTTEGGNSSILPGYYSGYDVTGQAPFELVLESGGKGQMTQGGIEPVSILFTNEKSAEINGAMQKMMGGGEWMNAYVGASERDQQYMEGSYDIRKNGLPSIYLPMPNNGIFMYIPPILFEYQGRPKENTPETVVVNGVPTVVEEKKEDTYITLKQNELIGDGRSIATAVFHYSDENKIPVSGINFRWNVAPEFKVISSQTTTDANGNAEIKMIVPLIKANSEDRDGFTQEFTNNRHSFEIKAFYSTPKKPNESARTDATVFKVVEKNVRILKPGFELGPMKVLLPQLDRYMLSGNVYALIEMINSPSIPDKIVLNDAVVFIERRKFSIEDFNRGIDLYFKTNRKDFLTSRSGETGGFWGITDAKGNFKIEVGGTTERKLTIEPLEAKLSDLTGRRKGELGKTLKLFNDEEFTNQVINRFFHMDKDLCALSHEKAVMTEEKLHLIGMLMVNANNGSTLMKDTEDELISQGWELMKATAEWANGKWKITDKLYKKLSIEEYSKKIQEKTGIDKIGKICDSLTKLGLKYENSFWKTALAKDDYKYGTKKIIQYALAEMVLPEGAKNSDKAKASATYYKILGSLGGELAGKVWEKLSESISEILATYVVPKEVKDAYGKGSKYVTETTKAVTDYVPDKIKETIQASYYSSMKDEIISFFNQAPEKIHIVYPQLQDALRDRSTELRAYYSSVAAWRYGAEMLKAYTDLGIDLVVKSMVVIVDAYSGNWTSIPNHFKKLDDGKKALGTAFTAGGFAMELYRLNNLWSEVLASFVYSNKCIGQGVMSTTLADIPGSFLFASAYAAEPGRVAAVNLSIPGADKLKYTGKGLPIQGMNEVFANSAQLENWMEENMSIINRLAFTEPDKAAELFESVSKYREVSEQLAVVSIVLAANPNNQELASEFNKTAAEAADNSKSLKAATGAATSALNELAANPKVNSNPIEKPMIGSIDNKMLIYIGSGLGGLLLVVVLIVIIRRQRRKLQSKPISVSVGPPLPYSPAPPVAQSPPTVLSQLHQSTPKFCPQCGALFTTGKKFCGKCGYKIPS